jgi:hypothetical protein
MILEPATSFVQGATRVVILTVLVIGFVASIGAGLWLGDKWFGKISRWNRIAGLPMGILFSLYLVAAFLLVQFW